MKPPILKTLLLATLVWLSLTPSHAAYSIYIQISDIPGDATAKEYQGWIEASWLTFGGQAKVSSGKTTGLEFNLQFAKKADRSTPKLIEKLVTAHEVASADIEFIKYTQTSALFYQIRLEEIYVVGEQMDGSAGSDTPTETVELACRKITWTVTTFNPARLSSDNEAFWDFVLGTGGSSLTGTRFRVTSEWIAGQNLRLRWPALAGERFQIRGSANAGAAFGLKYEVIAPRDGEMVFDVPAGDPVQFLSVVRTD